MLYDEPAAGLDPVTSQKIFDLLRAEQRAIGATVVMVSSDLDRLLTVTDRVGMMYRGELIFDGTTDEARACDRAARAAVRPRPDRGAAVKQARPRAMRGARPACWAPALAAVLACSKRDASAVRGCRGASAVASGSLPAPAPRRAAGPELALDPSDAPPARMKLLDAGQPPRRRLRYAWRAGQRETLVMDLRTSASTEEGSAKQPEIELPPVHIVLAIDPQERIARRATSPTRGA